MDSKDLRKWMEQLFRTDEELDAFCIDYLREVKRLFTVGMNRLQKENLILEYTREIDLEQMLREYEAARANHDTSSPAQRSENARRQEQKAQLVEHLNHTCDAITAATNSNFGRDLGLTMLTRFNQSSSSLAAPFKQLQQRFSELLKRSNQSIDQCRIVWHKIQFYLAPEVNAKIEHFFSFAQYIQQELSGPAQTFLSQSKFNDNAALTFVYMINTQNGLQPQVMSLLQCKSEIEKMLRS